MYQKNRGESINYRGLKPLVLGVPVQLCGFAETAKSPFFVYPKAPFFGGYYDSPPMSALCVVTVLCFFVFF